MNPSELAKVWNEQTMSKLNSCPRTTEQKKKQKKFLFIEPNKIFFFLSDGTGEYGPCVSQSILYGFGRNFPVKCNKSISIPCTHNSQFTAHGLQFEAILFRSFCEQKN